MCTDASCWSIENHVCVAGNVVVVELLISDMNCFSWCHCSVLVFAENFRPMPGQPAGKHVLSHCSCTLWKREKKTPGLFTCFKMWWNWQWTEQSSGCKTLAWKGPFAVSVSNGSLFIGLLSVLVQRTSLASCLKGVVHCEWRTTIAHLAHPLEFGCSSFWAGSHL